VLALEYIVIEVDCLGRRVERPASRVLTLSHGEAFALAVNRESDDLLNCIIAQVKKYKKPIFLDDFFVYFAGYHDRARSGARVLAILSIWSGALACGLPYLSGSLTDCKMGVLVLGALSLSVGVFSYMCYTGAGSQCDFKRICKKLISFDQALFAIKDQKKLLQSLEKMKTQLDHLLVVEVGKFIQNIHSLTPARAI